MGDCGQVPAERQGMLKVEAGLVQLAPRGQGRVHGLVHLPGRPETHRPERRQPGGRP
jgi:hypothetical protein